MVPFPMLPTDSTAERRLYEGFLEQLDDSYVVYHSVDWVLRGRSGIEQGEADFVIAHPVDGVLVIEAKGGRLSFDPATKRWRQSGRSGTHGLDEDPFHQARDEMHSLVRILSAQPGWDRWMPSYGYAVAFPDGSYRTAAHPGAPPEIVFDHDDLPKLAERVPAVMAHWRHEGRSFGVEGMDALALALGYRVEIRAPLRLTFAEEDKTIVELTNDQAWILGFVMHRKRAAVTGDVPDLEVGHYHALCVRFAEEAGLPLPPAPEAVELGSDYFEHDLPELLARAVERLGPRYDAIVVDEAQDFREWWWPALLMLHRDPDHGTLYLFADDNQNLYGGTLPLAEEDRLPPLRHNLRNSRRIGEFVSVFYDGSEKPSANGPEGRPPQVLGYTDNEDLAHLLAVVLTNLVEEERVPLEDIVVLTPSGRRKSRLRQRDAVNGFTLSDEVEPGTVLTSSVHGFKGLERPVVILAELGDRHQEDLARYLYVGGSRARNELIVLAIEEVARDLRDLAHAAGP